MRDADKRQLYRVVLAHISHWGKHYDRELLEDDIRDAHNGRPDGWLVTNENMWLFRQYRNAVSPSPSHMVDAALAYGKSRADDSHLVDAGEAMEEERTGWGVK